MVLEEATSSTEPSPFASDAYQDQQPPPSDADLYAGDRNPAVLPSRESAYILIAPGIYVNTTDLPKPYTLPFSPTPQQSQAALQRSLQHASKIVTNDLGRPLRQEEADAMAFHFAKGIRAGSFVPDLTIWTAVILAARGRSKMRFPGWTPDPEKYKFDKFLMLRGNSARFAWQIPRLMAYTITCMFVGNFFARSYVSTVAGVGQYQDPRLRQFHEEIQERAKRRRAELQKNVDVTPGQRAGETYEMARQRQTIQRSQQQAKSSKQQDDDVSPTGGSFGDEFVEMSNNGDSGLMSDPQTRTAQQQSQRQAGAGQRAPSRRYGDDNASPTAQTETTAKQSNGSAWDRLRQQAQTGQTSPRSSQPGNKVADGSSSLDSFAFSNADEEK